MFGHTSLFAVLLTNPVRKLFAILDTPFLCQEMCHDHDTFYNTHLKCVMIHDTFVDTFLDTGYLITNFFWFCRTISNQGSKKGPVGPFLDFRHGLVNSSTQL